MKKKKKQNIKELFIAPARMLMALMGSCTDTLVAPSEGPGFVPAAHKLQGWDLAFHT